VTVTAMRPLAKTGIVLAGYALALAVACAVLQAYVFLTDNPDRQLLQGMYAFGDSLVFLAAFGLAAVPATGAWLYFLRPYHGFWVFLSGLAMLAALTAATAAFLYVFHSSGWSVLRVLAAPLFSLAFLVAGAFSPLRTARMALLVAGVVEAISFLPFVVTVIQSRL
jgi:hypothetical protein